MAERMWREKGDTGSWVKKIQELLNKHGANPKLTTDGVFGAGTEKAVKAFQDKHGLKADGKVGPKTMDALEESKLEEERTVKKGEALESHTVYKITTVTVATGGATAAGVGKQVKKGDSSKLVEEIQLRITAFGGGMPTGVFDDKTEAKVKQFQKDYMGRAEPSGIVDEATLKAIDELGARYAVDFSKLKCPCGKCGGFGKGINKGKYYKTGSTAEAHHQYEYPGIHRGVLWAVRGMSFYVAAEERKILFYSAYRCSIDNEAHKRKTTNHMGKAVDLHIYRKNDKGNWYRPTDAATNQKLCDAVRSKFVKLADCQIGWAAKNHLSFEPSDIAPTWVHMDAREYGAAYLEDRFFCKDTAGLDGKKLVDMAKEG